MESLGEVLRLDIEDSLQIGLFQIANKGIYKIGNLEKEDLLLVSFCFKGIKEIKYGKKKYIMKEGDIMYFRPSNKFEFEFKNYESISYWIDLNYFKNFLDRENQQGEYLEWSDYEDSICKKTR